MRLMIACFAVVSLSAADLPPSSHELAVSASWIGNTLSGGDGQTLGLAGGNIGNARFMQNRHEDLWVAPNGTVVLNTHWDEGHHEVGIYRNGEMIAYARETGGGKGGWDVTGDDRYIYAGLAVDNTFKKRGVARYHWDGTMAPWKEAQGGNRLSLGAQTDGLATLNNILYASQPSEKRIRVIDTISMKVVRDINCERPGKIAIDPRNHTLWMIEQRNSNDVSSRIIHLDPEGNVLKESINDVVYARDIAFDPIDGTLAVTDNGPDQQVHFYDVRASSPRRIRSFGVAGGAMAGPHPGRTGVDRLHGPLGIGFDGEGNLYVGCRGSGHDGTVLSSWDRNGNLRWKLEGLMFVDCASIDPGDEDSIYTKGERFAMDWSQVQGKEWSHAAWIHDHHRYDDFPRGCTALIRRINGQRILYTLDMPGTYIGIYRFEGERAVPCGVITSHQAYKDGPTGRCVWRDRNADARIDPDEWEVFSTKRDCILGFPDADGNIWISGWGAKIRVMSCKGLDEHGAPIYSKADSEEFPAPEGLTNVDRIYYDTVGDTLYASGSSVDSPRIFSEGEQFITGGSVLVRVDDWWKGHRRTPTWVQVVQRYDRNHDMKSFTVAGDLLFTVERQTSRVDVYDARLGVWLQALDPPPNLGPVAGHVWVDIPYALTAHRRQNGEYVLIQEEDVYGKNILWRITASH